MKGYLELNADFRCLHCRIHVSAALGLCAVQNRNHCPYCLWSRHLDLYQAGDRLAACKAPMRPVGLTLKRSRNKYASQAAGELMLVHQCTGCDQFSLNRIAADDVPETIEEVFAAALDLPTGLRAQIAVGGIHLLGLDAAPTVLRQLYGQNVELARVRLG